MIRCKSKTVTLMLIGLCLSAYAAHEFKPRQKRAADIAALKAQGLVGENNQGYLGFVDPDSKRQVSEAILKLILNENLARKKRYGQTAKKENLSILIIGKKAARNLALLAKPGEWVQTTSGHWIRKAKQKAKITDK